MRDGHGTGFFWALAVALVVAISTLGEGGGSPTGTLIAHGILAALACGALLLPPPATGTVGARAPVAAVALFVLWAGVGAIRAPYAYAAWLVLLEIVSFGVAFWLAGRGMGELDRVLPPVLAVAAAFHGVAAVGQRVLGESRPATTFLNPNHLGAWLVASGLVAAGWALSTGGRRRAAGLAAAGLALAGVASTGSRGALVATLVGTGTMVALRWKEESPRARTFLSIGAGVAVLLAGALVASRLSDTDPYHWERLRIWKASFQAGAVEPWFGTGPGQFRTAAANVNFPQDVEPLRFGRSFRSPHSDLLRAWVEFGWPAAAAALAAFGLAIREIIRRRGAFAASGAGGACLAALAALAAQALFDDLSTRPAIVILAAVLCSRLLARRRPARKIAPFGFRGLAAAAVVILFLVGEAAPWHAWQIARDLPRGRLDPAGIERLRILLERNPLHPEGWRRLAEHEVGDGTSWDVGGYARAREAVEQAIRVQPADAQYRRSAAWVEGMACRTLFRDRGSRERAAARYREAAERARTDATIPLDEALFLLATGDPEGARRAAERALRIEPRAATPRVALAEALLDGEDPVASATARRLLREAMELASKEDRSASPYEVRLRRIDGDRVAQLLERANGGPR